MRGALREINPALLCKRIIPADAGSTCTSLPDSTSLRDHPRGCGEHPLLLTVWDKFQGSSPRMRGAQVPSVALRVSHGIIPADAGSTTPMVTVKYPRGDHPRGCGEHLCQQCLSVVPAGSSPRMRGALQHSFLVLLPRRIIPADAGSTRLPPGVSGGHKDHPRGCGEHAQQATTLAQAAGSSPRMRGALYRLRMRDG